MGAGSLGSGPSASTDRHPRSQEADGEAGGIPLHLSRRGLTLGTVNRGTVRLVTRIITAVVVGAMVMAGLWLAFLTVALTDTQEPDEPVRAIDWFERDGYNIEQISVRDADLIEEAFEQSVQDVQYRGRYVEEFYCESDLDLDRRIARGTFTATADATRESQAPTTDVHLMVVEDPDC